LDTDWALRNTTISPSLSDINPSPSTSSLSLFDINPSPSTSNVPSEDEEIQTDGKKYLNKITVGLPHKIYANQNCNSVSYAYIHIHIHVKINKLIFLITNTFFH